MNILRLIPVAEAVASLSKDRSTKVGALIVGPDGEIRSTGFNGFPRGVNDDVEARHQRPAKYDWTAHAEENSITQAARSGIPTNGCSLIVTSLHPCNVCSRMMISAGIVKVYAPAPSPDHPLIWQEKGAIAKEMLDEVGIEVIYY